MSCALCPRDAPIDARDAGWEDARRAHASGRPAATADDELLTGARRSEPRSAQTGPFVGTLVRRAAIFLAVVTGATVFASPIGRQPAAPARKPDIYFAPTRQAVAGEMLALAGVGPGDVVYDLGSGDGRIVILAAQKYGARSVGIEIDPRLAAIAREVAREGEVADRVTFVEGDLFVADISGATVVTLYLSPGINRELEPKLRRELKPGTRIVSHQFPIGRWPPDKTLRASDGTELFLWVVPAR